ncbi:MAG: nucleotide exchange factor GrpE [Myxococcota bacterium]
MNLEERMRTMIRAQSKLSLRLDEISRLLSERPRSAGPQSGVSPGPAQGSGLDPAPVLDVLDRLDDARRSVADRPAVDRGLEGIAARLEGLLGAMGIDRRARIGVPVDPKLFRVVGVEHSPSVKDAVVIRVVRAAALRGTSVIREGEVIVSKKSS